MRKLALLALLLALVPGIPAASLSVSAGGGALVFQDALLSLPSARVYMDLGFLVFGEIGRKGLVKALDDPHSSYSGLRPEAVRPGRDGGKDGFVLSAGPVSAVFSTDGRPLAGFSWSSEYLELGMLYAAASGDDGGFHDDRGRSTAYPVLYAALNARWNFLRLGGLASFSPEIGFRGVLSAGAEYEGYSLHISYGSLLALYDSSPSDTSGIRGSFGRGPFSFTFSLSYGSPPVFSEDYLSRRAYASSVLSIGDVRVEAETETSFTQSGTRRHDEIFTVEWKFIETGYDTGDGFFIILDFDYLAAGYRGGTPFVSFSHEAGTEHFRWHFSVSTDDGVSLALRILL